MGLVRTWLEGCGLGYAVENFIAAGVVSPVALSELDLAHYEALGVKSPEDRRKLFYLVQRIKLAVSKDQRIDGSSTAVNLEDQVAAVVSSTSHDVDGDEEKQTNGESTQQQVVQHGTKISLAGIPTKIPIQVSPRRTPSTEINPFGFRAAKTATTTSPGEKTTPDSGSPIDDNTDMNDLLDELLQDGSQCDIDDAADDEASASCPKSDDDASDSTTYRRSKRIAAKSEISVVPHNASTNSTKTARNNNQSKATGRQNASTKITVKDKAADGVNSDDWMTPVKQEARITTERPLPSRGQTKLSMRTRMPVPRVRSRPESKLQNPSKSMRTGKQLSTIPADSVAPMSPLVDLKTSQLDFGGVDDDDIVTAHSVAVRASTTRRKSGLVNTTGAGMRSRSTGMAGGNASDSSDSDEINSRAVAARNRRTSLDAARSTTNSGCGNQSDSDSSSTKRRRSMVHTPSRRPLSHRASSVVTKHKTGNSTAAKRRSLPATGNQRKSIGGSNAAAVKASFKAQISSLRRQFNSEHELFRPDEFCRDDANIEDLINEEKIMVVVRKRPTFSSSSDMDIIHPLDYGIYGRINVYQPRTRVDLTKHVETIPFAFDAVYDETHSNRSLYSRSVRGLIPVCLNGNCATVFAYGQTGSGKTFTVLGKEGEDPENMGLYRMAAADIFAAIDHPDYSSLTVSVSLFEIYGGKLYDLFNNRAPVKCLENYDGEMVFPGLSRHDIFSPEELMDWIEKGSKTRSVGSTSRNADSSRSHAVMQLHIRKNTDSRESADHGRLVMIDLAGNERANDVGLCSRATRLEGAEINTSLLALKEVIRARARNGSMVHVPFRGSRLTQVLKESFVGENSRCLMIACIAPDMDNCEQTLNTLRYADRVKERNAETGNLPSKSNPLRGGRRLLPPGTFANFMSIVNSKADDDKNGEHSGRKAKPSPSKVHCEFETSQVLPDSESVQDDLVSELLETHQSFLAAVLGMVEYEIQLVDQLRTDGTNWADILIQLETNQENQQCLISDLRECFQTYESIHETILDSQLGAHKSVLVALLDLVQDEMVFLSKMSDGVDVLEEVRMQLESIQQRKLARLSELRDCFEAAGTNAGASTAEVMFSESFNSGNYDQNQSSDEESFEDLRD